MPLHPLILQELVRLTREMPEEERVALREDLRRRAGLGESSSIGAILDRIIKNKTDAEKRQIRADVLRIIYETIEMDVPSILASLKDAKGGRSRRKRKRAKRTLKR